MGVGEGGGARRGAGPGQGEGGISCVWQSFGFLQLSPPAKNIHTQTRTTAMVGIV